MLKTHKKNKPANTVLKTLGTHTHSVLTRQQNSKPQTMVKIPRHMLAWPKVSKRYSKHKGSIENPSPQNSTTLSTHFLKEQEAGKNPTISWKFLRTNIPTFNPVTGVCKLCICEKFTIVFKPEITTLNSRNEIFSACRHKKAEL